MDDVRLTTTARETIILADAVRVSPITFFEIGQKVRIGKWPEMAPYVVELPDRLGAQGGFVATLTADIALLASTLDWPNLDPFDRLIGATAELTGDVLVSSDAAFDTWPLPGLRKIWA